jgi:hypothetical protein
MGGVQLYGTNTYILISEWLISLRGNAYSNRKLQQRKHIDEVIHGTRRIDSDKNISSNAEGDKF